jgi:uncharacterized protein with ParB-like and HNH nuclease domain
MAQTNIKVSELVNKVQRGELTLPEMQRRYVWPATRVRDLLDSLYRGYPSDTILVWETDEEMPTRELTVRSTRRRLPPKNCSCWTDNSARHLFPQLMK